MKIILKKCWKYRAMDANGKWWFYKSHPMLVPTPWKKETPRWMPGDEDFNSSYEYCGASYSSLFDVDPKFPNVDWQDSLQYRDDATNIWHFIH